MATQNDFDTHLKRILLIKLKTIILKSLKKEDVPEFIRIIAKNDTDLLLKFAYAKNSQLPRQLFEEIINLKQQIENTYI